jgi:hypothetical protein
MSVAFDEKFVSTLEKKSGSRVGEKSWVKLARTGLVKSLNCLRK